MQKIEVVHMHLRELASPVGEIIFENNKNTPLVVLCESPVSEHTSVILFAPKDCYFASAGLLRYFLAFNAFGEYALSMGDDYLYKIFLKWIRKEGIKKDFAPRILFGLYAKQGGRESSIGKKFDGSEWALKVDSIFIANSYVDSVLSYFFAQLKQFQELSFIRDDWRRKDCIQSKYAMQNMNYIINSDVFTDRPQIFEIKKWMGENGEWLMRNLEDAVERLEQGEILFPNLPPRDGVTLFPQIPWRARFSDLNIKRKCAILRSRMIALLDFPWIYSHIVDMAEDMRKNKDEAINELSGDVYDDVLSNLDSFVQKIRTKYPIVDANPLTMPISS